MDEKRFAEQRQNDRDRDKRFHFFFLGMKLRDEDLNEYDEELSSSLKLK